MTIAPLIALLALPARADLGAMTATLEAIHAQTAVDPASGLREDVKIGSSRAFDGFSIQTLAPVEYVDAGEPRRSPPPKEIVEPAGAGVDYYFEGVTPLNGITIYTPKKGDGSTSGDEGSPTDKYGKWGKYAVAGGAVLAVAGLAIGGGALAPLLAIAGLLVGAGAVLWYLFGRKK